jgi:hypothetical protein
MRSIELGWFKSLWKALRRRGAGVHLLGFMAFGLAM